MKSIIRFLILLSVFLVSCQAVPDLEPSPTSNPQVNTLQSTLPQTFITAVPTITRTPIPTEPAHTATSPTIIPAAVTVMQFAEAVKNSDFETAAGLFSNFSLMIAKMTRSEAAVLLQSQMASKQWVDFKVMDTRSFNEKTVLVHVTYSLNTKDPKTGESTSTVADELWPVRLENGMWLYNRENLIDFHTLDVAARTTAGLTLKPRQLTRYSDHLSLTLLAQNQTNEPIVLGQGNEIMALFLFGEMKVEAEKARFIFDKLRSYPDTVIIVKGEFGSYPDGVIIRQWKNYKTDPWFNFQFSE